jgi:hypothetical protein
MGYLAVQDQGSKCASILHVFWGVRVIVLVRQRHSAPRTMALTGMGGEMRIARIPTRMPLGAVFMRWGEGHAGTDDLVMESFSRSLNPPEVRMWVVSLQFRDDLTSLLD